MPNKEGRWVTINGRAIFIGEGQSLEEALNSKGQVKKTAGGSASAPKKAKSSDIPEAYRGIYKIGKDDPDSYKTGDTVDGMKILASLDPKNDDDDETPYAYLTDSKEHPVVTIVHDRVYDVEKPDDPYEDPEDFWKPIPDNAESGNEGAKSTASAAKPSRSAAKSAIAKKAEQGSTDMTEWTDAEKQPVFEYYYNKKFTTDEAEYDITETINEDIQFDYKGYYDYAKKRNKELGVNTIV